MVGDMTRGGRIAPTALQRTWRRSRRRARGRDAGAAESRPGRRGIDPGDVRRWERVARDDDRACRADDVADRGCRAAWWDTGQSPPDGRGGRRGGGASERAAAGPAHAGRPLRPTADRRRRLQPADRVPRQGPLRRRGRRLAPGRRHRLEYAGRAARAGRHRPRGPARRGRRAHLGRPADRAPRGGRGVRARPRARGPPGLRDDRASPPRRRPDRRGAAHPRRRAGLGVRPPERRSLRRALPHARRGAGALRRARLALDRRVPDAQPDPPGARAHPEVGPRDRRRPPAPSARRRDEGRRRAGRDPPALLPRPAGELLPAASGDPCRLPRRHALRWAARGGLPRARAEELRLYPLRRRARPRGRREVLRHLRGAAGLRPLPARGDRDHPAPL